MAVRVNSDVTAKTDGSESSPEAGRAHDPFSRHTRRLPSPQPVIEKHKLYRFSTTAANLERNNWRFPSRLKYTELDRENYASSFPSNEEPSAADVENQRYNLLYTRWEKNLLKGDTFDRTDPPISQEVQTLAYTQRWITEDYKNLWHKDSGGSAAWVEEGRCSFILQTPNDERPFCSLSISEYQSAGSDHSSCGGLFVADEDYDLDVLLSNQPLPDETDPLCRFLNMFAILPIRILQAHGTGTHKALTELVQQLGDMEDRIAAGDSSEVPVDPEEDNKTLNKMHLKHTENHRRWNFEMELANNLLQFFDTVAARDSGRNKSRVQDRVKPMRSLVDRQLRYSEALRYDFDTVPKRIRTQSKSLFNLVIQRDNKINIQLAADSKKLNEINMEIAQSSARIAKEAQRDSASMKTIAVLTLIFLPGTAIASFFSMQLFNWMPDGGGPPQASPYLYIYFVITIPLTLIIIAAWLLWYYKVQKPMAEKIADPEIGVSRHNSTDKNDKYD